MFKAINKQLNNTNRGNKTCGSHNENSEKTKTKIPKSIDNIEQKLQKIFTNCSDLIIRKVEVGKLGTKVIIVFFDGFVDSKILSENVIEPIVEYTGDIKRIAIPDLLKNNIISSDSLSEISMFEDAVNVIAGGDAVIFIDDSGTAFKIGVKAPEKRQVEQSDSEMTLKGSREGFSESLKTNTILLRKRIKNPNFKVESLKLGRQTNTDINIYYIEGIVRKELVDEVKSRINKIDIDSILSSGYIEQFIQDGKYPLFPMVGDSEKPDKVAGKLLEGRVAIIADGSPTALTVPFLLIECIQTQEDYYGEYYFSSFIRILRAFCIFLAIYLPALYVAFTSFHQSALPYRLMITILAAREGIPFSSLIEALIMVITFEILREAGIRMPRAIGQAVSIVGAIVLGEAAVSAGIASAPIVIVTGLSGICSFMSPPLMKPVTLLRIFMIIAANTLGLLGIVIPTIILLSYLANKSSFGIPYLVPFSPMNTEDYKDTLIVVPIWAMFRRPRAINEGHNMTRTKGKFFGDKGNKQ